jgi:RNA polymerase sigma-70 factor (ECF subfamily)
VDFDAMEGLDLNDPQQVEHLWRDLHAQVRRRGESVHDADDVVQETWLRALRQAQAPARWSGWLKRVAKRLVHESRRAEQSRAYRECTVARSELAAQIEHDERLAQLVLWLDELPAHYRRAVLLRYIEGREFGEIAKLTGTSEATVRSQLKRGLDKLRARAAPRARPAGRSRPAALFATVLLLSNVLWTESHLDRVGEVGVRPSRVAHEGLEVVRIARADRQR